MRVDLAAAYRLVAFEGWDDLIYSHISASVPQEPGHFLINPFGLDFDEVTASNLVKINDRAEIIGDSPHSVNVTGFALHAALHGLAPMPCACCICMRRPQSLFRRRRRDCYRYRSMRCAS